jgi:lipopolysaccharide/colanic/teichoic acid biosynthesis glycosyltransferase
MNSQKSDAKNEETFVTLPFEKCEEFYVEKLDVIQSKPVYSFFKRFYDIVFSLVAMSIMLLPVLIISLIVKLTSKGSVFYHQERLGLNGKKIDVIKFRTMVIDAEKNGPQWSDGDHDPRITSFGRFLRKTRLDEVPQFWCILKGDMSLIGPRPERECYYNEFEKYIHGFNQRLYVKPGLSGLAQVRGGYYLRPEEKILYDVEYIKTRNFWLIFSLQFKTFFVVLKGEGQN